eukprot:151916_1
MGTVADTVTDNRTYYNCPVCRRRVWAYGDFVGTQCIGCPGYNVEAEEARKRAAENRKRHQKLMKSKDDLETKMEKHVTKSDQIYFDLEDQITSNIKSGQYDENIDLRIDKNNPLKKLENTETEIYENLAQMAKAADKCWYTAEVMEQTINEFEHEMKDFKDAPSFVSTVVKQYKMRAKDLKNFKVVFRQQFSKVKAELKVDSEFTPTTLLSDKFTPKYTVEDFWNYIDIFKKEQIESVDDIVDGYSLKELENLGIKKQHARRIMRVAKGNKKIYEMMEKIEELRNAVKTVKQAYKHTQKDIQTFIKSFKDITMKHKSNKKIANKIEYIANNLQELEKIIVTQNSSERKKGGAIGAGIGFLAGGATGVGIGWLCGGPVGGIIGGVIGGLVGAIIGGFLGIRFNPNRYNVKKTKVDREGTKNALLKLSEIILENMKKKEEYYKDDDLKQLEDDEGDMAKSLEELEGVEATLSGIVEELSNVEESINGRKDTKGVEKKCEEIMEKIEEKLQALHTKVNTLSKK